MTLSTKTFGKTAKKETASILPTAKSFKKRNDMINIYDAEGKTIAYVIEGGYNQLAKLRIF